MRTGPVVPWKLTVLVGWRVAPALGQRAWGPEQEKIRKRVNPDAERGAVSTGPTRPRPRSRQYYAVTGAFGFPVRAVFPWVAWV